MTRVILLAASLSLAAFGCGRSDDTGARQQAGGLDWGGGGGSTTDSTLADPEVAFLGEITLPEMQGPFGIASGPEGNIVVADTRAHRVFVFSPRGRLLMQLAAPGVMGVAVDNQGRIYAGDRQTGTVRIFDAAGAPAGLLGGAEGVFQSPSDIAYDPTAETILVTDMGAHNVRVFSADSGLEQFSFGSPGGGSGQFARPNGIAVDDANGRIYVTDGGNHRIQVFSRTGTYIKKFGSYGSSKKQFNAPGGLAVDGLERLYVTDAFQGTLQVVDNAGLHVAYLGEMGNRYGQVRLSADAVLDKFNRLLVTSYKTRKILIYGIDDFATPPHEWVPLRAKVALSTDTLTPKSRAPWVAAVIEIKDGDIYDVDLESVRLNELPRDPAAGAKFGDKDEDGVPDLEIKFSYPDLRASLPPGEHTLELTGDFTRGGLFEGSARVTVKEDTETARGRGGR